MRDFMKLFLVIVFNIVAVTMVINVDNPWTSFGIIFLQVLFLCYQLIARDRE
jgi:hypothetical protein